MTFTPNWGELQRMQDDAIVRRYMAQIDTRIDKMVLFDRIGDLMQLDVIRMDYASMAGIDFDVALESLHRRHDHNHRRTVDSWHEHNDRDEDLQKLIEAIRGSNDDIEAERHADIGFGPFDHNDDKYLAFVLDWAGEDYADENTGSTEWMDYILRFGRVCLLTDDRGFRTVVICDTEEECKRRFKETDNQYGEWAAENDY